MPLLEVRNVTKEYRKGDQVITPLRDVSLTVERGDFVSLMGASGSGKSTLLNLVAGIDHPTRGELLVNGADITKLSRTQLAHWRAAHVGYIFQLCNLIPVLTAWENVELPLLLLPLSRAEREKRVGIALEAVGLSDRADHYPRQLSGGQEQRVGIARAVVTDPAIVVADEPTGDLDAEMSAQILDLLQRLNDELGTTFLLVTHDPKAAAIARRQLRLEKGELLEPEGPRFAPARERGLNMWRFAPYVLKNLWRHRTRTALTVSGAAVALFVFTFIGAVQGGLAGLTEGSDADRTLIVFQASRFCPATSRLPEDYVRRIAKLDGVQDVAPIKVYMNNCRASLDAVVFHGMPPAQVKTFRDVKPVAGDWESFESRQDGAMVGQALARRRGLSVGERFSIGEVTVTVAGIVRGENPADDNLLFTHLDFLQRTRGLNSVGTVTQLEVRLKEGADARVLCREIDALFRGGPVATDTRPKGIFQARQVGDLIALIGFARYLGFACIGLVLALVATTTVMAVQDRIREHAVLQTLGFTGGRIFGLVMAESLLVSVAGGLLGVVLALGILGWKGMALSTEGVTIPFEASAGLAVAGLIVTAVVGTLAALVPAWQASRAEIVSSLRHV